jgi:hypothetical protein
MMAEYEEAGRRREVKSLLEQIQQLPHNESQAAAAQAPTNPYYEQWSAYHAAYLAAANTVRRPQSRNALNPWFLVLATGLNTVVAAVLAVLITLSVVRQEPQRASDATSSAPVLPDARSGAGARTAMMLIDPAPTASNRPVELQPLGSPEQPLRLEALKPSLLPLTVQPEEALAETFILVLSGLPAKAYLQGAERIGSDAWLVPPNSLTRLQLTMPEWSSSLIEVGVELRRPTGGIAGRTKAWFAVPPPPVAQAERKVDQAALREILQNGDQLLGRGDIVAARAVYERAAGMGSAQAALALGSTYDPTRLWSLGVFGMVGNKDKARQWYRRADQLGHPNAKDRLRALAD